ncbi:MAG: hypothetical protein M2R45_04294 [Verrucomicrobia subdivision 3 bacterium]|nr:hypothetical protein [Limisphaerales bacterium]MCS1417209.1 hypothetical protein [Limisphaerales bacterium]
MTFRPEIYYSDTDESGYFIGGAYDADLDRLVPLRQSGILLEGYRSCEASLRVIGLLSGSARRTCYNDWEASGACILRELSSQPSPSMRGACLCRGLYRPNPNGARPSTCRSRILMLIGRRILFLAQNFFGVRRDHAPL